MLVVCASWLISRNRLCGITARHVYLRLRILLQCLSGCDALNAQQAGNLITCSLVLQWVAAHLICISLIHAQSSNILLSKHIVLHQSASKLAAVAVKRLVQLSVSPDCAICICELQCI